MFRKNKINRLLVALVCGLAFSFGVSKSSVLADKLSDYVSKTETVEKEGLKFTSVKSPQYIENLKSILMGFSENEVRKLTVEPVPNHKFDADSAAKFLESGGPSGFNSNIYYIADKNSDECVGRLSVLSATIQKGTPASVDKFVTIHLIAKPLVKADIEKAAVSFVKEIFKCDDVYILGGGSTEGTFVSQCVEGSAKDVEGSKAIEKEIALNKFISGPDFDNVNFLVGFSIKNEQLANKLNQTLTNEGINAIINMLKPSVVDAQSKAFKPDTLNRVFEQLVNILNR